MTTDTLEKHASSEAELRRWRQRRKFGEPIEHILGQAEFMGRLYFVGPGVYTTDKASEILVEQVVQEYLDQEPVIVDVGTGCGNIAITLAKEIQGARVIGCDLNPHALQYARRNAENHGVDLQLSESLYVDDIEIGKSPDVIVANLPWGDENTVLPENDIREFRHMPLACFHPDGSLASYIELIDSIQRRRWSTVAYIETGEMSPDQIKRELLGASPQISGPVTRLEVVA